MKLSRYILLLSAIVSISSCLISNDMSYPKVSADITGFDVEGQVSSEIDPKTHTIHIVLNETANISKLKISRFSMSEGSEAITPIKAGDIIDLTSPMTVTLRIYEETQWTISATQPIARYVRCANEAKPAQIDVVNRSVTVFVSQNQPLETILINEMKLEPEGSRIISTHGKAIENGQIVDKNEDCHFPMTLYCVLQRIFLVEYKGQNIVWTFNAVQEIVSLKIDSAIGWCHNADIQATYDGSGTPCIQYRQADSDQWSDWTDLTVDGSRISCRISNLAEATDYMVRVSNGEEESEERPFSTGTPDQIDNMGFDNWHQVGKVWYPNPGPTVKIWDTANKGASLLGDSSTIPVDFVAVSGAGKQAARLESRWAAIAFAAGNIYTGEFGRVNGIGAELQWGTPFTGRPKALHGYYAYEPKVIDRVKPPYESLKGQMDQCQILVMLTDWDEPFKVNTTTGTFVDQENDPHIVAYAKFESPENTGGQYKEFTLPLEWRRPDATPKYAVIIACASYKGDFFTGGVGSMMYVDEFEFIYD